ncbi:MAG: alpha/beta hydrolase [Gemmatimonadaceae bacterium]|nr:alpha/beta hydrolase [Gemmatimonadaceae bacterium]
MSRRQLLAVAAMAPLAASVTPASRARRAPTTFVLVHGAWHGGWCWKKLLAPLRAGGHYVFTPSLTGLGERAHLLSSAVDLDTHIEDVVATIEHEDLQQVVLVGHSYGGMVITGVAARVAPRLSHLVYLDAFLPDAGKALRDYAPIPPTRADGWRVPPPGTPGSWGVTDPADVAWMMPRLGDQPLKTFTRPLAAHLERMPSAQQTFIRCTNAPFFAEAAERARALGFAYHEMRSAGHDAMITQPAALAGLLSGVA